MSQMPSPYQPPPPMNYYGYGNSPRSPRPASVTTLAILGIIGGSFLVVCMTIAIPVLLTQRNAVFDSIRNDSEAVYDAIVAETALRPVAGILLLTSSIGALFLKRWARVGMLAFAVLMILINIVDVVVTKGWIDPTVQRLRPQFASTPYGSGVSFGQVIGWCLWIGYSVLLLVYLNLAQVKAAFDGLASQSQWPGAPQPPLPPSAMPPP